ncbi:autophagy-related protein 23-like [Miscanthus floridulus]|uniref:autophagy-related protein 23-like n=1 Tax=Miscanthus floridulus TaxID=154761 RepID=UPI003459048D
MELSDAFQERVRQMEDARNHRLALLNAEKEIQAAKLRILSAKIAATRRLECRRRLLERRSADLATRALADIDAARARRLLVSRDLSSVRGEIEEAQRREEDWDRFYEAKRKEMEEFQAESRRFEAETREEVQRLRDSVSQLKSALQELQSSAMYSNNTEIAAAEARKSDLTAKGLGSKKAKLGESLASARHFSSSSRAFQSQVDDGDQKEAQPVLFSRWKVEEIWL